MKAKIDKLVREIWKDIENPPNPYIAAVLAENGGSVAYNTLKILNKWTEEPMLLTAEETEHLKQQIARLPQLF